MIMDKPLDLRAVEAQLIRQVTHSARCFEEGNGCLCGSERAVVETFAHCRALRESLKEAKGVVGWFAMQREKESSKHYIELEAQIAATLAQATDNQE